MERAEKRVVPREAQQEKREQKLELFNRRKMLLSGVEEVLRFDETGVSLATVAGKLTVRGSDLKIGSLNVENGELSLQGVIDGLQYTSQTDGGKGLKKLFR